jgi:AP-2 complex subunit alpha
MNSTVPIDVKQPDKKLKARGLTVYIADIRSCTSREQEEARVTEEMANIRQKFSKAGKALSSYDRRKYVWKIVYTHLLGYEVDFGHIQAIELLAGQTYSEKMCGYLALTLLIKNTDELMNLVVNTMKRDLQSHNPEYFRCLALTAAANLGGSSLAHSMGDDVRRLIKDESTSQIVLKKALLCLLRLARDAPAAVSLPTELELVRGRCALPR